MPQERRSSIKEGSWYPGNRAEIVLPRRLLEEYFNRFREPNGDDWLVIDSIVRDPQYLTQPSVTSVAFKKQPNASGWDPTPCRADQPR